MIREWGDDDAANHRDKPNAVSRDQRVAHRRSGGVGDSPLFSNGLTVQRASAAVRALQCCHGLLLGLRIDLYDVNCLANYVNTVIGYGVSGCVKDVQFPAFTHVNHVAPVDGLNSRY